MKKKEKKVQRRARKSHNSPSRKNTEWRYMKGNAMRKGVSPLEFLLDTNLVVRLTVGPRNCFSPALRTNLRPLPTPDLFASVVAVNTSE